MTPRRRTTSSTLIGYPRTLNGLRVLDEVAPAS